MVAKQIVDPNADSEARRTAQTSRWSLSRSHNEKYQFTIGSVNEGSFHFNLLIVEDNSNWVYPHALRVIGGKLNLTDYELCFILAEYMRFRVTSNVHVKKEQVGKKIEVELDNEPEISPT